MGIIELIKKLESHSGLADWITAIVSILALIGVVIEYRRQKARERLQVAQDMIARLDSDEMLVFVTTTLDWGTGLIPVPQAWRDIVKSAAIEWNRDDIRDAMKPQLSHDTRGNPTRLLYRHAFVQLFNHLERVGNLLETGAICVRDLRPMAWLTKELMSWSYAATEERTSIFMAPMNSWYQNQIPNKLLAEIAKAFPADVTREGARDSQ